MKVNPLLSEIIKGTWLLGVENLNAYAPIVKKIISGETISFQNNAYNPFTIIDENGYVVKEDEDGKVYAPEGSIAVVSMIGEIIKYGDYCTYGADEICAALQKAEDNQNIKGIIFKIDGPGGSVSSIGPFLQFKKNSKKPIIGLADHALSLHYWTLCAVCDHIIADNDVSARFGSVGVVSSFIDVQPVYEELGYKFHEIYADESKDKNLAFRMALEGKYDLIKEEHLSPVALKFQAAVRDNRPNLQEEEGVLTGKTFDADKAIGLGMIDEISDMKRAVEMIHLLSEIKSMY